MIERRSTLRRSVFLAARSGPTNRKNGRSTACELVETSQMAPVSQQHSSNGPVSWSLDHVVRAHYCCPPAVRCTCRRKGGDQKVPRSSSCKVGFPHYRCKCSCSLSGNPSRRHGWSRSRMVCTRSPLYQLKPRRTHKRFEPGHV